MEALENFLTQVLSDYGSFVFFLVLTNGILLYTIKMLWGQNQHLADKLLETVESNTRVLTQMIEKIEGSIGNNNVI